MKKIWLIIGVGLLALSSCERAEYDDKLGLVDADFCFTSRSALDYQADLALAACDQLLSSPDSLNPNELFEAYFNRGLTKRELGDLDGSKLDLQKAVELSGDDDDAIRMLAWTFREIGEYQQSVDLYGRAIELAPDNWRGYLSRCVVLGDGLGDHQSALQDCQKAISLGHISDDTIFFTSHLMNQLGSHAAAAELIEQYSDRDTVSARVYEQYILALLGLKDDLRAIRALDAAKSEFPSDRRFDGLEALVVELRQSE